MQPYDVKETESDSRDLYNWIRFVSTVTINEESLYLLNGSKITIKLIKFLLFNLWLIF